MDKFFNIIGLIINMSGSLMIYYYTPKAGFGTFVYNKSETKERKEIAKNLNQKIAQGMLILFVGFFVQLIALFL
jgi:hypothetical protein